MYKKNRNFIIQDKRKINLGKTYAKLSIYRKIFFVTRTPGYLIEYGPSLASNYAGWLTCYVDEIRCNEQMEARNYVKVLSD